MTGSVPMQDPNRELFYTLAGGFSWKHFDIFSAPPPPKGAGWGPVQEEQVPTVANSRLPESCRTAGNRSGLFIFRVSFCCCCLTVSHCEVAFQRVTESFSRATKQVLDGAAGDLLPVLLDSLSPILHCAAQEWGSDSAPSSAAVMFGLMGCVS